MGKAIKLCPVCRTENVGGKPHTWHKTGHKKTGYTTNQLEGFVQQVLEHNQVRAIICEAVDLARQPTHWQPKPKLSRNEYHREYYKRNINKRRKQRRESKLMRRRLRPLIADLCRAVDLARISAQW